MGTTGDSSPPQAVQTGPLERLDRRSLLVAAGRAGLGLTLGSAVLGPPLAGRVDAAGPRAPITLAYWTHNFPPANVQNKKFIAAYRQINPQVTIKYDFIDYASYDPRLLTAFAGGNGPDLFWDGDWTMAQYIQKNVVAPFDPGAYGLASQQAFIDRYEPHTFDGFISGGKLYTGGVSEFNTLALYYNKALFRAAGIAYPSATEPMTWEQLASIARKLTAFSGGKRVRSGIEFFYNSTIWAVLQTEPLVRQLGGELVDPVSGAPQFDSLPVLRTMQFFHDLRVKYKANDPAFPSSDVAADFAKNRVGMWIAGIWAVSDMLTNNPKIQGDIGVAPIPTWDRGGTRVAPKYAWGWYVNPRAAADNQRAAWRFISYLTTPARSNTWYDTCGYTQPLRNHWSYMLRKQPLLSVFRGELPYAHYVFRSRHFGELSSVLNRAFQRIQTGQDPATVMKGAQSEALSAVR